MHEARLKDVGNGFGKKCLGLLISEIRLEGKELKIRGSYSQPGDAFGLLEKMKLGEVPSFVRDWCARQDESGHWAEVVSIESRGVKP